MGAPLVASVAALFRSFLPGFRQIDGGDLSKFVQIQASGKSAIVAFAGGGQTNATRLTSYINRVETVASGADSVMLPPAIAGLEVAVINAGANAMAVFPNSFNAYTGAADTQAPNNGSAQVGTAFSVAANATAWFLCPVVGQWKSTLST